MKNRYINWPMALIGLRFSLSFVNPILAATFHESARFPVLIFLFVGILSDLFDGIIARAQKISSPLLRRLDSQVDLVFWLSILFSAYLIYPQVILEHSWLFISLLLSEALIYAISFFKFKREISTHSWLSKLWALSLLIAFTGLFGFEHFGWLFKLTLVLGLVSQLDVILIIFILPKWNHDIPSFYHAWLIRKGKTFKRRKLLNG